MLVAPLALLATLLPVVAQSGRDGGWKTLAAIAGAPDPQLLAAAAPSSGSGVSRKPPAGGVTVELSAGPYDRVNTPVLFDPPGPLAEHEHFTLTRTDNGAAIPAQRAGRNDRRIAWILRQPLRAGQTRRYFLTPRETPPDRPAAVTCQDDGRGLLVKVGDRPVLRYNHAVQESPEGIDACFRRSGYIHPLFTPSGRVVTGDFPADHPHQHAVFFAWVNTTFQGRNLDFWNQAKQSGLIEHAAILETTDGPVFAQFVVRLRHSDLTAPDPPQPVLNETWTVRVYNLNDYFLVDLASRQQCASTNPLVINEYHYGGMAIRGSDQWFDPKTADVVKKQLKAKAGPEELARIPIPRDYLTSEGGTWIDGNATRARWVEMHGAIDGQDAGVALLCDSKNFRFPQPVRLHPSKPYFCFAPMSLGEFRIQPGDAYTSRYRFYVHDGPADADRTERMWRDYASPPTVRVVAESATRK